MVFILLVPTRRDSDTLIPVCATRYKKESGPLNDVVMLHRDYIKAKMNTTEKTSRLASWGLVQSHGRDKTHNPMAHFLQVDFRALSSFIIPSRTVNVDYNEAKF